MSDTDFEDPPQQQAQDQHGGIGVATWVSFISHTTISNSYGICNIYVTFKQPRISASAKKMFLFLLYCTYA